MIYSLKYKEFTEMLRKFGKTVYGKAMFLICYTPFFLGLYFTGIQCDNASA